VDGYRFSTDLRVRFSETDAQGVVHNAVYLVWLEIARIAYLARVPGGYRGLVADHEIDVTTVDATVRYRAPALFDDELRIWTRATDLRGARFRFQYVVERISDPTGPIAEGATGHACVGARTLRPIRMPGWLSDTLAALERADT
jgi:acyl-CoA thioester hydrolase